jgi:hypothetical protein
MNTAQPNPERVKRVLNFLLDKAEERKEGAERVVKHSKRPAWMDEPHTEWPAPFKSAMDILARAAERRMAAEAEKTVEHIKRPDWIDKPHEEWPTTAKTAYGILAQWAQREVTEVEQKKEPETTESLMMRYLITWFSDGFKSAHQLDSRLAKQFKISLSKATEVRKRLGFVPKYRGGPIKEPKGV